jgi:hypothetical protein
MHRALVWIFSFWILALSAFAGATTHALAQNDALDQAKGFFDRGEYGKAAPIYEKLAAEGDAIAQYTLAEMYFRGIGVLRDFRKAAALYESAAEKNTLCVSGGTEPGGKCGVGQSVMTRQEDRVVTSPDPSIRQRRVGSRPIRAFSATPHDGQRPCRNAC